MPGSVLSASWHFPSLSPPDSMILQGELVVFAQGVADPVFGEQNAAQVRMAGEPNAGEIVNFAFVPIGGGPNPGDGGNLGQLAGRVIPPARQNQLHGEAMPVGETLQVIDDFQVRLVAGFGG